MILKTGFLWILLAGLVYGGIHSAFASTTVKLWVTNQYCLDDPKMYRFIYVLQSFFFTLIYIFVLFLFPDQRLYLLPSPWRYLFMLIEAAALVCGILSLKQAGIWSFLGLESFKPNTSTAQTPTLMTGGFYRFVRHPLYLFSILFIWFVPLMTWNILAFDIGSTIYMFIGSIFEERKLAQDFGQVYIDYQKRVPSFLPRLIRKP